MGEWSLITIRYIMLHRKTVAALKIKLQKHKDWVLILASILTAPVVQVVLQQVTLLQYCYRNKVQLFPCGKSFAVIQFVDIFEEARFVHSLLCCLLKAFIYLKKRKHWYILTFCYTENPSADIMLYSNLKVFNHSIVNHLEGS